MTGLSQRQRNILICLGLAVAVATVYWPVRHFDLVNLDDPLYVTDNSHVQHGLTLKELAWAFTTTYPYYWHPLTWLSHMLDHQLFGSNAGAYHLVNVLFHIVNTLLLFGVLDRMTRSPWRSGFVAALFALHPLHVESVAWVAERKDLLSTTFWMLTLGAYLRYVERPDRKWYWLTVMVYVLGLMAKPMLVTLPFVLLLLDYWPLGRTQWLPSVVGENAKASPGKLLLEKLPFLALSAVSSAYTFWSTRAAGSVFSLEAAPIGSRVANAVVFYTHYVGKAFWPVGLTVSYSQQNWSPSTVIGAGVILIGITCIAFWRARREPQFVVGWLWYLGTLVPVSGLVQAGSQPMADHYSYLPLLGLFIMATWSIPRSAVELQSGTKMIVATTAAVVLGACAVLSWFQIQYWKNSETLFRHALEMTPDNYLALNNLGIALAGEGKLAEAIDHLEQQVQLKPNLASAHYNLGNALFLAGKMPEASEQYQQTVRISPRYAEACNNLGNALSRLGKVVEAIEQYQRAIEIKPDYPEAHNNLGDVLLRMGNIPDAIMHYKLAIWMKPDFLEAHRNLGLALEQTGKTREAIEQYGQALRIKPDYPEVQNNLAWLLATRAPAGTDDPVLAVTLAERACQLTDNQMAPYLDTLAAAYASASRFKDAVTTAQKAIALANSANLPQVVKEIEPRLQLYRNGQAYRQAVDLTNSPKP